MGGGPGSDARGGGAGAGSGVIETVYSCPRRKTMPARPVQRVLISEEIRANAADAILDVLAGFLLCGHQPDSCHQKHNQNFRRSLHDAVTSRNNKILSQRS
jgi:hypothetical protein